MVGKMIIVSKSLDDTIFDDIDVRDTINKDKEHD